MNPFTLLVCTGTLLLSNAAPAAPSAGARAGEVQLTWKGKRLQLAKLPADFPPAAKTVVEAWAGWADEHEYRLDLDAQGRVLLVSPERGPGPEGRLKAIGKTETWFDQLFPMPARPAPEPAAPKAPPAPAGVPEDPETPPPGAPKTDETPAKTTWTSAWGAGNHTPDSETAVLFVVRDEPDQAALLEHLTTVHPYLKDWSLIAKKQTGFVLEEPLCGGYVEKARGQQEWDPEHELVNRAGQLLLLRRFGQEPFWLQQAVGWEAEIALDGTLFCFPYRNEFIGVGEHTGWPVELKLAFKDRADKPLQIVEFASWQRGRFEATAAHAAWGLLHYAAATNPAGLAPALVDLAQFRTEHDRRSTGPSSWERIPGYEIPAGEQERILQKHLGADVLESATRAFRKGIESLKAAPKADSARGG